MFIKNIRVSIVAYICVCIIVTPLNFLWDGFLWHDNTMLRWAQEDMIREYMIHQGVTIGFHTIVSMSLCFLVGRKFLIKSEDWLTNIYVVLPLYFIIMIAIFITFDNHDRLIAMVGMLATPIFPISETVSYFARIKSQYGFYPMAFMPPLVMWAGMVTKSK